MPLSAGTNLGPYEILAPIGSGGMGEVYKGRDTRLDRVVAIKVSSEQFTERFDREARAVATLNHPNICQLYDVGPNYLVMEFVDGLPVAPVDGARKLLDLVVQIADGLAAAHAVGLIHRDLKPDNILVTRDGRVKILDFGLAKTAAATLAGDTTRTIALTDPGSTVGTVNYMSPEQARGVTNLSPQSDQFSFGLVLYELAAGKRAFVRSSAAETMTALIREDAEPLPVTLPAPLRWIIERLLAKEPAERYDSTRDLFRELKQIRERYSEATSAQQIPASGSAAVLVPLEKRRSHTALWIGALVLIGVIGLAFGRYWGWSNHAEAEVWSSDLLGGANPAIGPRVSPDGQTLAFQAMIDGMNQLEVLKPASGDSLVLTKEKASGFISDISWSADGTRLFYDRYDKAAKGIFSIPMLGGEPRLVLENAKGPQAVADGSLLMTRANEKRQNQLYRFWPRDGRLQALRALLPATAEAWSPPVRVFPDGKEAVFYGRPLDTPDALNQLYAIDLESQRMRRLAPSITIRPTTEYFALSPAPSGSAVLVDAPDGDLHRILEIPRDGSDNIRTLLTLTVGPWFMDAGRDGSIYVDQVQRPSELLRFSTSGGVPEQLGISPSFLSYGHGGAVPLPDGRVLMGSSPGGRERLLVTAPGQGLVTFLETPEETSTPSAVLGMHEVALLEGSRPKRRIAIASIPDDRIVRRLDAPTAEITGMAASPDGRTIYYVASGVVWAVPSNQTRGTRRKVRDGDGVAVDPRNGDVIIQIFAADGVRLVRMPTSGSEQEISFSPGQFVMYPIPLSASAVGSDGRILVQGGETNTWSYYVGVIDPSKKSVKVVHLAFDGDTVVPGWAKDGKIVSVGFRYRMNLWHFRRLKR